MRERLGEVEADAPVKAKHVRESVRRIYQDGFHVCNDFYGQRREQDEECMFCDELLYRSKHADSKKVLRGSLPMASCI